MPPAVAIVVLDYPRLSETFIAQEILALEQRGLDVLIVGLRRPPERIVPPLSRRIGAPVLHLPKFPHREPLRVLRAWWEVRRWPTYRRARRLLWRDLLRSPGPDRLLRFVQGLVLARELDSRYTHLHAHFLYYTASVVRYVALLRGLPWSCSAHAIDIWTTPQWEKREKLADCRWAVTCTEANGAHLRALSAPGKVSVIYHGLDFTRFPAPGPPSLRPDGGQAEAPVVILSVGRVVDKKGYADLLEALRLLPADLQWKFVHIGGGILRRRAMRQARGLGLDNRVTWLGPQSPEVVLAQYRSAHLFALACRVAANGDRDGLPNVLLEAQSQRLPVVSTTVSAISELIDHGHNGLLVPQRDPAAFAAALQQLIRDPALRERMGGAGEQRVRSRFAAEPGFAALAGRFGLDSPESPTAESRS